jgi:hypothetical protein
MSTLNTKKRRLDAAVFYGGNHFMVETGVRLKKGRLGVPFLLPHARY